MQASFQIRYICDSLQNTGGTEYDGVDLYFLQGRSSYQMLFSIDGSEPYYNSMATVNPMLIDDAKALVNNLQGDEKNA